MSKAFLAAAALACASFAAYSADYFVVVPVQGRSILAANINVALSTVTLPRAVVNMPYAGFDLKTLLSVTGDAAFTGTGVQWSLVSGALPAGLTLNADGTLSGTPSVVETRSFSVRATYKTKTGEQAYQLITGLSFSTWNAVDKGSTVTLSGDTATAAAASMVRGTVGKSSGKWYWEVKVSTAPYGTIVGVANGAADLNNYIGSSAASYGLMAAPPNPFGYVCFNGCGSNAAAQFAVNNVMGFALDMDTRTLRVYRDGFLTITATSLPAGALYPAVGGQFSGTYVANFGSQGFWLTPPTGYNALQ